MQHVIIESDLKVGDTFHYGYTNIPYMQYVLTNILHILQAPNINCHLRHIGCANKYANLPAHQTDFASFNFFFF